MRDHRQDAFRFATLTMLLGTACYFGFSAAPSGSPGQARNLAEVPAEQPIAQPIAAEKDTNALLQEARQAMARKQWAEAIRRLDEHPNLIAAKPLHQEASFRLWQERGQLAEAAGDRGEASRCYAWALTFRHDATMEEHLQALNGQLQLQAQARENVTVLESEAQQWEDQDRFDKALECYEKLLTTTQASPASQQKRDTCAQTWQWQQQLDALLARARQWESLGEWPKAIEIYQRLLMSQAPTHVPAATWERLGKEIRQACSVAQSQEQWIIHLRILASQQRWAKALLLLLGQENLIVPESLLDELRQQFANEMTLIPAGSFSMGDEGAEADETPGRTISLPPYYIDTYEVTNQQYLHFLLDTDHSPPLHWRTGRFPAGTERHPVAEVSWADAALYCQWAGKRLPTEAEWEKASRGEDARLYPWGNTFAAALCNSKESNRRGVVAVGSFPLGKSSFGCYDMAGNVLEWTNDLYLPYPGGPTLPTMRHDYRVARGGSYCEEALALRCSNRFPQSEQATLLSFGFRCALDAQPLQAWLQRKAKK